MRLFHTVSEGEFCEVELCIDGVLKGSPSGVAAWHRPSLPLGIEKNGHLAYRPDASNLVGSFSDALALGRRDKGKPVVRRGRKAYGPSSGEVARLPNERGVRRCDLTSNTAIRAQSFT